MSIIQKRIGNEFRYVTSYGQQRYIAQKMQHKLIDYVYGQVSVAGETLIAMTSYNFPRESGCIVTNPSREMHFTLGGNYAHYPVNTLCKSNKSNVIL